VAVISGKGKALLGGQRKKRGIRQRLPIALFSGEREVSATQKRDVNPLSKKGRESRPTILLARGQFSHFSRRGEKRPLRERVGDGLDSLYVERGDDPPNQRRKMKLYFKEERKKSYV